MGKYPGNRAWPGAEVREQHLEKEWVRFGTARAEQGEEGVSGEGAWLQSALPRGM